MTNDESLAPRPASRLVLICLAIVLAFGIVGRLVGQTTIQLWLDEADWAIRAATGTDTFIRPAGSMWIARHSIALHNSEFVLRLPSLIAGIATLPLLYLVLRRLVRPAVAAAALVAFVAHPVAMGMSREFKPYAVEAALHLFVLLLTLRMLHRPSTRRALDLAALTTFAPLFSWSIVFSYPGAYLFAFVDRLRSRGREHKTTLVLVAGVVATFIVLGLLFALRIDGGDRKAEYWGNKYNVFFVGNDVGEQVVWTWKKLRALLRWPGRLDLPSYSLRLFQPVSLALVVVGVVSMLVRRRWRVLVLLVLPFALTLLFNILGQWPWGLFRTNFYLLPLALLIATVGMDQVVDMLVRLHPRLPQVAAVAVAVGFVAAAPRWAFHFDEKITRSQTSESAVHTAMDALRAVEEHTPTTTPPTKPVLLMDNHACGIFRYYKEHHTEASRQHRDWFDAHVDVRCVEPGADWFAFLDAQRATPAWVMTVPRSLRTKTAALLHARCVISHEALLRGTNLVHCAPQQIPAPAATPASGPAADDDDDGDGDDD